MGRVGGGGRGRGGCRIQVGIIMRMKRKEASELSSCVKVEVAVLNSPSL